MAEAFDFIAIGSGTAAQVAVHQMADAGKRCAVIDYRPYGGTCALRGCDPKKMMVSGEEALAAHRRLKGKGIEGSVSIDWGDLQAFKRSFTDPVPEKQEARYERKGVATFHGTARFAGPGRIVIGETELCFSHALIATGAEPRSLGIEGEPLLTHSDAFLELESLPDRIVFVGGGYIAAEFAHLAARAGAKVTIIQRGRILKAFDPDTVDWLMPSFDDLGIEIVDAEVNSVAKRGGVLTVHAGDRRIEGDLVVHAAGRVPAIGSLDLGAGDVACDEGRLVLTAQLRSQSNPKVFAAGDAAANGPPLTPVSSHDAKVVLENILEDSGRAPNYCGVPSALFTEPPAARVGMLESEAHEAGLDFTVNAGSHPGWFSARRLNEEIYGHKVLVETGTGRILGAHLVGPDADELINIFGLAIRHGLNADDIKSTMFAYPTAASDAGSMLG
ncbi:MULTISPECIES: dihydrolipoyl dehydrogenase family protein [Erythrobacteraceae]|jgi:glutathione reductase (NADPH)|uniref:NAD(P)/FAD-dependent oxidoreductase n=2 Tax=Erythrobacteraceae TaxID=335929 RepID=A0A844YGE3_9SPHN|nr:MULTISPECIES: NAD(P)/FAD-dependent oxidoreductase [Erythrobacteraceae]MXO62743.1 NAD(P)/FAD-dependent oxidoreductase [Qipengyuania oceanensis]RPF71741.1 NAD(P)/FAD-dependent oxidoreductase [Aurantiacibacter spongiae]